MIPNDAARIVAKDAPSHLRLLSQLGIEHDPRPSKEAFVLVESEGRLELRPPGEADMAGIWSRFPPDRGRPGRGRNPLVRAFGNDLDTIFDLTAGLGGDAYRLAEAGHRVKSYERNPAVYALLITGWTRDREAGRVPAAIAERLEFAHVESADMLTQIGRASRAKNGVYLDPMYPRLRRSKALPRRELQVLRQLLGDEGDAAALVEAARRVSPRVVVKRPHRAKPLVPGASFEIATKLVRFDVYLNVDRMGTANS